MVAAGLADVEVLRSRALGRPGEEVVVGRLGRRHEQVAELLKKAEVGLAWRHRLDRELEVDDRLGGKPRDGRGADVLEADRDRPERLADATELLPCLGGPAGVVLDDADGGIEALVERRVAPQNRPSCVSSGGSPDSSPGGAVTSSGSGTTGSACSGSACGGASSASSSGRRRKSARRVSSIEGV